MIGLSEAMATEGSRKVKVFDGTNFSYWKTQMEDYLYMKDLYVPLLCADAGKGKLSEDEYKLLDRKAIGTIRSCLSERVYFNIAGETTTVGLMEALGKMYEKPSGANKVFLIKKLFNSKKDAGTSAAEYMNQFNSILAQLTSVKITFEDEVNALLILSGLPDEWNSLVVALGNTSGDEKLTLSNMVASILGEESRRK